MFLKVVLSLIVELTVEDVKKGNVTRVVDTILGLSVLLKNCLKMIISMIYQMVWISIRDLLLIMLTIIPI